MTENTILNELVFDQAAGALGYKNVRYLLIRPETLAGVQKAMEESNQNEARRAFFQGGFQGGYLSAKTFKEIHDFQDHEIINFMMKMGTEIGWGLFRLIDFDPTRHIIRVRVEKSPFAEAYGASSKGVCHLIRGVLSGLATVLFDRDCTATEILCLAKGDQHCVFHIKSEKKSIDTRGR